MKKILIWTLAPIFLCLPAQAETTTLEQALTQAYQNNPSLEAERAKLRVTDEDVSQALSHWRPTIDATTNVGKTYQNIPAQKVYGTSDFADTTRGYGVQVTQPIFRGFRTSSETKAAEKEVMSGRAKLQAAEQKLLLDTATAFLDTMRDEAVLSYDSENEDVLRKKLEEVTVRSKVGDLTQTDIHQAESRLARAQVSRAQAENALSADRSAYTRLVGDAPGTLQEPSLSFDAHTKVDDLIHAAVTKSPDVVAAQYALDQADAEIDLSKGSLAPELDLVGNASRNWGQNSTLPGEINSSQILLQLKIPLYHAGSDYSGIRAAQQTSTQRRMELEDARHRAQETARNAWQTLQTAESSIKADKNEIDAAHHALEGVKIEAHVGTRTTLDVLNAEQELLDAKTDLAKSEHDRDLAVLQIHSAIGELTADALRLPLEPYDPSRHYDNIRGKWIGWSDADADRYSRDESTTDAQN